MMKYIPNNDGIGYTYGFEFFLQKKPVMDGKFSGWISYSYSISKEKDPASSWHFRDFDQRHSINLVLRYSPFKNFSIDSQYKYASGFPWTPIVKDGQGNPVFDEEGEIVTGKTNSLRYPHYERLDIRLTYARKIFDSANFLFYIEVINILNRENIYQYYWSDDYRTLFKSYMLPRMPFFGIKLEI